MSLKTRPEFIKERDDRLEQYWSDYKSAPVKRGWNSFMRAPLPSKMDIKRACQDDLAELNNICISLHHAPIWIDQDEEEVKMGKPV